VGSRLGAGKPLRQQLSKVGWRGVSSHCGQLDDVRTVGREAEDDRHSLIPQRKPMAAAVVTDDGNGYEERRQQRQPDGDAMKERGLRSS
jgi:hypothetical protein